MRRLADTENRSVLFVCLGNICRSPSAAAVLRHLLATEAPQLHIDVDSAGTSNYHIGSPPDVRSQRAALRRGIDMSASRARQVTAKDFERFELILAMDRTNWGAVKALRPDASRAEGRLCMEYAGGAEDLEVPDPYYGGPEGFERVLDLTMQASRGLIAHMMRAEPFAQRSGLIRL